MLEGVRKVLIIDDEKSWGILVQAAMKNISEDVEVISFTKAEDALSFLINTKDSIHIVLLDLQMPGMDGYEVLEQIKDRFQQWIVPIVVFSSNVNEKNVSKSYALGANSYIDKPHNFADLIKICEEIIEYWFGTNRLPDAKAISDQEMP